MVSWPIRWALGWIFRVILNVLVLSILILWSFRWIPLVPVPVIAEFFSGKAPKWQWLGPSEAPPALMQAFRMRLSQTRQKGLSPPAQAAAFLLFPEPQKAWGAEILGALLKLLWGEERLYHLYLSSAAWGPQVWGAKSAAIYYLHKDPLSLSPEEVAELILLREFPQAAQNPTRPSWFQKQKLALARQIAYAAPQKHP